MVTRARCVEKVNSHTGDMRAREEKTSRLFSGLGLVRYKQNCDLGLENASLQSAVSRPHLGHSFLLHGPPSQQITHISGNLTLSLLACLHMVSQPTCCIIRGTTVWAFFLTSPLRSSKQEYKGATTATKVEGRFFSTGNFSSSQPKTWKIQTQIRQQEQFKIQWSVRKVNTNGLQRLMTRHNLASRRFSIVQ